MIENFPQDPINEQTQVVSGITFTFNQDKMTWFPPDTGENPDIQLYDIDTTGNNIQIWFPKSFREENRLWSEIRNIRNQKIEEVEWRYNRYAREIRLGISTTDNINNLDTYVQALADITEQEDPTNISWPSL